MRPYSPQFLIPPTDLVIPDNTGVYLSGATLRASGPPLIISNSPEQIRPAGPLTILYRGEAPGSRFRLFFHHQNATRRSLQMGYALVNRGERAVEAYIASSSGPCQGDADPAAVGARALRTYFASAAPRPTPDRYLATIRPGEAYIVTEELARGHTAAGMYDLALRATGSGLSAPQISVVTLAYERPLFRSAAVLPSANALLTAPVAAPDAPSFHRTRGIYPHADRLGSVRFAVAPDGQPRWLDLAGPAQGRYARVLPGEFEPPLASGSDGQMAHNPGNYGVVYDLNIELANPLDIPVRVDCLMNLAGGRGGSALQVEGAVQQPSAPLLDAFGSWVWRQVLLAPGATRSVRLAFSLPGGASGAHRLFLWPQSLSSKG